MKEIKLKIADIVILFKSNYFHETNEKMNRRENFSERFLNFFYKGDKEPEITIEVNVVQTLPQIKKEKLIFFTRHFEDKTENWYIFKEKNKFIYYIPLKNKKQIIFVDKNFKKALAFVLPIRKKYIWRVTDLIYDFLHVFLIDYLSFYKKGIFVHGVGIKNKNRGFLFVGKSGAGKTTLAKLWAKHAKEAVILNDDRIIIRKIKNKFFIYGTPWHGAFYDYLSSQMEEAILEKIFFLKKNFYNFHKKISIKRAFKLFYPILLPPFWNKKELSNFLDLSQEVIKAIACFSFGFVKNKSAVKYIQDINERNKL